MRCRTIFMIIMLSFCWIHLAFAAAPPPAVDGKAAVLMVAGTKQVLFEKNAQAIMYPASTTKITTLITALEKGKLNSTVTVSPSAAAVEGSSLDLRAGDRIVLLNALYGMMLVSGNDAAEAVAAHVAGSVPAFVDLMNSRAEAIGATRTHYSNPHGLPDPINHFTTAYDLALITDYALKNPIFAQIVSTREYKVDFLNRPSTYVTNTNKLLKTYPGATGVKTGYTEAAGECLVAAAKRGNIQLIAVVLHSETRWDDAARMLDYGFQQLGL
jgi:D-alanyl-D-alanine carboxypeptidase (penicillin-binding protein 5/6)